MSESTGAIAASPLVRSVAAMESALLDARETSATFLPVEDKQDLLLRLQRLEGQLVSLKLEVMADSGDVAAQHGTRSTGVWLARESRRDASTGRRDQRLATSLRDKWHAVARAFSAGELNERQVHSIVRTLDALPRDTESSVLARAEAKLVELAAEHPPEDLTRLGWGILTLIAPDVVDERERLALERAERRARQQTRLRMRPASPGMVRVVADVPKLHADLLRSQLHAFTSPRRDHLGEGVVEGETRLDPESGERIPYDELLGHAFCSLLERVAVDRLPVHGATAATVMVTIDLESLLSGLGVAGLSAGGSISASEARRLACNAQIVPAVLGSQSELLDLGRASRLFSPAQRRAMEHRDRRCRAAGCDIPASWAEAHHLHPWQHGGRTDLADGVLLCPFHHHRIHDTAYDHRWHPDGDVRFHRRR